MFKQNLMSQEHPAYYGCFLLVHLGGTSLPNLYSNKLQHSYQIEHLPIMLWNLVQIPYTAHWILSTGLVYEILNYSYTSSLMLLPSFKDFNSHWLSLFGCNIFITMAISFYSFFDSIPHDFLFKLVAINKEWLLFHL